MATAMLLMKTLGCIETPSVIDSVACEEVVEHVLVVGKRCLEDSLVINLALDLSRGGAQRVDALTTVL